MNATIVDRGTRRSDLAHYLDLYFKAYNAEMTGVDGDLKELQETTEHQRSVADGTPAEAMEDLVLRLAFLAQELLARSTPLADGNVAAALPTCLGCLADAVMLANGLQPREPERP